MWQYNYSQPSEELMHYGKKGMKWGRRRVRMPQGRVNDARADVGTANKIGDKHVSSIEKKAGKREKTLEKRSSKLEAKKTTNSSGHTKRNVAIGMAALATIATMSIVAAKSGTNVAVGQNFINNFDFNKARIFGPSNIDKNLAFNIARVNGPTNIAKNLAFNAARPR